MTLAIVLRVLFWYACAVGASIYTKAGLVIAIKAGFVSPLSEALACIFVTAIQLAFTALAACFLLMWRLKMRKHLQADMIIARSGIPVIHALANLATNAAIICSNSAVVQVLKAMEPIFTLLFVTDALSYRKLLAIGLVVAGGAVCGGLQLGSALFTRAGELGVLFALISESFNTCISKYYE